MKLHRPKPAGTVRLLARDEQTGKSKSMTVYDTTPDEVIERFARFLSTDPGSESGAVPSAASSRSGGASG